MKLNHLLPSSGQMMKEIDEKATNIWVSWKWIRSKKGDRGQISCEGFV